MATEFNKEDLLLIRIALGDFHFQLTERKNKIKENIIKHPKGSIFYELGNFQENLKGVNEKLAGILKLEKKINTIYPVVV